jgi:hypothetical protein
VFVRHDEVIFHLTITLIMTLLAGLGYGAIRLGSWSRQPA